MPAKTTPCSRMAILGAIVLLAAGALNAQPLEFDLALDGPRSVVQGRSCFLATTGKITQGKAGRATAYVTGLPPGASVAYIWNISRSREAPEIGMNGALGLKIMTSPDTPVGDDYNLVVTYNVTDQASGSTVTKSVATPFAVHPVPPPMVKASMPRDVPLPAVKRWEQNMRRYGSKHVEQDRISCCGGFTGVWFYDGARAFLQIADYTGEKKYLDFARKINEAYRDYINGTGGRGFARFPHGLKMFYQREDDQQSRNAVKKLQESSYNAYRPYWNVGFAQSREIAFSLSGQVLAEQLGFERTEKPPVFEEQVALTMGHFEQWFISETADFVYPFMVGLSAEALIDYYEMTKDPVVPWLLKLAADKMYPNPDTWDEATESMKIVEVHDGKITRGPAPDLNLMIAPLYGWVFQQTGDVKYREIGDRIFTSGVRRAYLDGGKQFTQNYRWSFKYVEWRSAHSQSATQTRSRRR